MNNIKKANSASRILFLLILIIIQIDAFGVECPEFETALETIINRIKHKEDFVFRKQQLSSEKVIAFKQKYKEELKLPDNSNRDFIAKMEADSKRADNSHILYFDVENSIQKKLNDQIFGEKTMVDSVNTSFMKKFYDRVQNNPELRSHLDGQYKDYKSLRLRLSLKDGEDPVHFENLLNEAYKQSVKDFASEFDKLGLNQLINPRTDDVANPERWFLAGSGHDSLEANMAARGARTLPKTKAEEGSHLPYRENIDSMARDITEIEDMRMKLESRADLINLHILDLIEDGKVIPSKEIIGILRKFKPSDFKNDAKYLSAVRRKIRQIFGENLDNNTIALLTNYQRKVDSMSPPLFSRERVEIDLADAKEGIVSVDFTGVGVDNLYQQMKALSRVNYKEADKAKMLKDAFVKLDSHVENVTNEMNQAKRYFSSSVRSINGQDAKPLFSGDDGIYMPEAKEWGSGDKLNLVRRLGEAPDPSKYRVTFVKTKYPNGDVIPSNIRSQQIVRAEKLEKELRESMIAIDKFSSAEGKKIITAIDFTPSVKGGNFKVLVGGKNLSSSELKMIEDIVKSTLKSSEGEIFGGIITAQ